MRQRYYLGQRVIFNDSEIVNVTIDQSPIKNRPLESSNDNFVYVWRPVFGVFAYVPVSFIKSLPRGQL